MEILQYNELDVSSFQQQYEKIVNSIRQNDFHSVETKKLIGTSFYRAKINHDTCLLFKIVSFEGKKYALMLETINNRDYENSRFLRGAKIDESKIEKVADHQIDEEIFESLPYINNKTPYFYFIDKFISFDDQQVALLNIPFPLLLVGSAGSGKTMVALEKMKSCRGNILYVTKSVYLASNTRRLYYSNHYSNDNQSIDFLSYEELLNTVKIPAQKRVDFKAFSNWLQHFNEKRIHKDANKIFEEIKGVITGNSLDKAFLTKEEYLDLGIKQSIYEKSERKEIYTIFERYLNFLNDEHYYDDNIISFAYLSECKPIYDYVIVDEIQDFTPVQLFFILKHLKNQHNFILSGDSHQIVHPNFFSWSKIKHFFYQQIESFGLDIIFILNKNYRNSQSITTLANKILKLKNARFGSIDKESHFLSENQSNEEGHIYYVTDNESVRNEINAKTHRSNRFAVIVLHDDQKEQACHLFKTPLIFTIYEAKGLEYDNLILYNFVSSEEGKFREIAQGVTQQDLEREFVYARASDKADKSLEIYKFYINALYVAVTRAIKNLYIVESNPTHPLLMLLRFVPSVELGLVEAHESSQNEWKEEMQRLALQGKQEQADAIQKILEPVKEVPWEVINIDTLFELKDDVFEREKNVTKRNSSQLLLEHALIYEEETIVKAYKAAGKIASDFNIKRHRRALEKKYHFPYMLNDEKFILKQIDAYGVDFRNHFNQTPLMLAGYYGNHHLVKLLREKGADVCLVDSAGMNAFQIALQRALVDEKYAKDKFPLIYESLAPDSLKFLIGKKLDILDFYNHAELELATANLLTDGKLLIFSLNHIEYFLVYILLCMFRKEKAKHNQLIGGDAKQLITSLNALPESIVPAYRKQSAYLSKVLAKNASDEGSGEQKLFIRMKRGHYALNPDVFIQLDLNSNYIEKQFPFIKNHWVPIGVLTNYYAYKVQVNKEIIKKDAMSVEEEVFQEMIKDTIEEFAKIGVQLGRNEAASLIKSHKKSNQYKDDKKEREGALGRNERLKDELAKIEELIKGYERKATDLDKEIDEANKELAKLYRQVSDYPGETKH